MSSVIRGIAVGEVIGSVERPRKTMIMNLERKTNDAIGTEIQFQTKCTLQILLNLAYRAYTRSVLVSIKWFSIFGFKLRSSSVIDK